MRLLPIAFALLLAGCATAFRLPAGELWVYEFQGQDRLMASWGVTLPPGTDVRVLQYVAGLQSFCAMTRANSAVRIAAVASVAGGPSALSLGECQPAHLDSGSGW